MKQNFVLEIEHLLEQVPPTIWEDHTICGLMYDLIPWHGFSSVAIQTQDDDRHDPAGWKYYDCADSDASRIREELDTYQQCGAGEGRLVFHELLIEAAEALLGVDFSRYGQPNTIEDYRLYGPFQLQVYDPDETFRFNYCEYVLARRLDGG